MRRLIFACALMLLLVSCATVDTNYRNPVEEATTEKGQYAKVVFYNDTNMIVYPSSSAVGIEVIIDGMLVSKLRWHQQIEVYVKKGRHDLVLTHWDLFKFVDRYEIEFTEDNYMVDISCRPVSTVYEIRQELPKTERVSQESGQQAVGANP